MGFPFLKKIKAGILWAVMIVVLIAGCAGALAGIFVAPRLESDRSNGVFGC